MAELSVLESEALEVSVWTVAIQLLAQTQGAFIVGRGWSRASSR
jgi:hypothetical protein